jgi:alcohol dehydrogenase
MRIRAAILDNMGAARPYRDSRPLDVREIELDPPGPGEVLVRIKAAGLCHSDLSVINGDRPRVMPMVLGHEAAGIVETAGPNVTSVVPGDHVAMVFVPSCGHCVSCATGRPALCEPGNASNGVGTLLGGGRRLHERFKFINHHLGISAFAEAAVVSEKSVVKIDPSLPFDEAALFGCAVLTGMGAVVNTAQVKAGDSVAIVGMGGVGFSALLAAAAAGAREIVAIDLLDGKLETARQLGATAVYNAQEEKVVETIKANHPRIDVAVETAGSARALELAYKITGRGGITVTAGLANPAHDIKIQQVSLVAEERTLKGSYVGSCVPLRDIPNYVAMYGAGKLPVDRLLSERVSLDGLNEAFDRLAEGNTIRQVLVL